MSIDAGKEAGGQVGRQAADPFSVSYTHHTSTARVKINYSRGGVWATIHAAAGEDVRVCEHVRACACVCDVDRCVI